MSQPSFDFASNFSAFDINLVKGVMLQEAKVKFDPHQFIHGYHEDPKTGEQVKNFHDKQIELLEKKEKYIVCITGRRPGKTHALAGKMVLCDQIVAPGKSGFILYSTTTLGHAHELIAEQLKKWNRVYKLGWDWSTYKKWGTILTPNGNIIRLMGLHDEESWKKPQGLGIKLSIVDESQMIKSSILKSFDEEICMMGLLDFTNKGHAYDGQMILAGNPPKRHIGHLTQMWHNAETSKEGMCRFHMAITDNPFYNKEQIEAFYTFSRQRLGLREGEESPAFLRNCFGIWAEETDTKVYLITPDNFFLPETLQPTKEKTIIMGIDLGYHHHDAIAVLEHYHKTRKTYVIHEWQKRKQTISKLAEQIIKTRDKYKVDMMVADFGALGVKIRAELRSSHGLKIKIAKKTEKMDWVEKLRDLVMQRKILFRHDSIFVKDAQKIDYDENFEKIDDKEFHSDMHDAVLYPMRWIMTKFPRHFMGEEVLTIAEKHQAKIPEIVKEDRDLFKHLEKPKNKKIKRTNFNEFFGHKRDKKRPSFEKVFGPKKPF